MLRQRLLAAALGLPTLFVLVSLNWLLRVQHDGSLLALVKPDDLPLLLIVVIIAGFSGWEVSNIVRQRFPNTSKWNGVYAALLVPFLVHSIRLAGVEQTPVISPGLGLLIDSLGSTAMVMLLFLAVWSDVEQRGREGLLENVYVVLAGLYLGGTLSALLLMQQTPMREILVMFLFVVVFAMDTAAYFGGKNLHGPKLAPNISPSKTVSGAVCGLATAILFTILFKFAATYFDTRMPSWNLVNHLSWAQIVWIGFSIGILGQIGDLVESAFKRWGGVKDSGNFLPGHGGFLDRFDSLFLSAPICYLLVTLFLHLPR